MDMEFRDHNIINGDIINNGSTTTYNCNGIGPKKIIVNHYHHYHMKTTKTLTHTNNNNNNNDDEDDDDDDINGINTESNPSKQCNEYSQPRLPLREIKKTNKSHNGSKNKRIQIEENQYNKIKNISHTYNIPPITNTYYNKQYSKTHTNNNNN
eukprot:500019_1